VSRNSSVGIATELRAGRSVDRILLGARYSTTVQTGPRAYTASYTMDTGSFSRVKRTRRGVHHPPTSSAEVKIRVELHTCSFSGSSCPVIEWNFTRVFGDVAPRRLVNSRRRYGEAQCCLIQEVAYQRRLFNSMTSRSRRLQSAWTLLWQPHLAPPFTMFIFSSPINSWFRWSR
jgi:hypothetical protein